MRLRSLIFYFACFIEDITARTCFSEGVRPICDIIARTIASLIGGFFSRYDLKYFRAKKKPMTAPRSNATTINTIANHNSIIVINSFVLY